MLEKITGTQQLNSKKFIYFVTNISIVIFFILSLPANTKYIIEKKQGKIATLSSDEKKMIEELYNYLGYNDIETSLLLTKVDDADQGHANGSFENMEALIKKFKVVLKHKNDEKVHIIAPGSWKALENHHCRLEIEINKQHIFNINTLLHQNSQETCAMLAGLMNLAIGEYVEQQQANNTVNFWLSGSGHHSADYKGNILGLQRYFGSQDNNYYFESSIKKLEKRYRPSNSFRYLKKLAHEFGIGFIITHHVS